MFILWRGWLWWFINLFYALGLCIVLVETQGKHLFRKKTKRGEEQLVDVQFCVYANLHTGAEGRVGIFHNKIAVSAEIKKNRDWLRPWCPRGHSQFSVLKRWCSLLWTLGPFVFFTDFVCVCSCSFFCQQIKFYCTQHWRLLVTFWSLKSFGPPEKSEVDLRQWHLLLEVLHVFI